MEEASPSPSLPPSGDCEGLEVLSGGGSGAIAAVMFAAGLAGNGAALALLVRAGRRRRRGSSRAAWGVLVRGLVLSDLAGTCATSPAVLAAYGVGRSLVGLGLCRAFAFALGFFGLATLGSLGALALERGLALGAPYLYRRRLRLDARRAALLLAALYAAAAALAALPLLGFGRYVQHCPGTWCFIQTRFDARPAPADAAFALLYAALLLLLGAAVLLGNLAGVVSLLRMRRRRPPAAAALHRELDHLLLLALMTAAFAVCSFPFTIRVFMNRFIGDGDYEEDLRALRFLSVNSIINPWVFTILRPPVLRVIRSLLCCRVPRKLPSSSREITAVAVPKPGAQTDICKE